jgi:hypothetical protein
MDWMKGQGALPVLPKFEERAFAMFMNRFRRSSVDVAPSHTIVAASRSALSEDWCKKWQILDESFEQTVQSLSGQLGKPIGDAIVDLVKSKFPFSHESTFPL